MLNLIFGISLFLSASANAITSFDALRPEQTPLLVGGLEAKLRSYQDYYKERGEGGDLTYFWFAITEQKPAHDAQAAYLYLGDPDQALAEIEKVYHLRFSDPAKPKKIHVISEFNRLQQDILSRGYESSKNTYWARPKELQVSYYKDDLKAGPSRRWNDTGYLHSMVFEMQLRYQLKGKTLGEGEKYPKVFLRGPIHFRCDEPTSKCSVSNVDFEEAGISWDSIPAPRGGISSAGGD